MSRTYTIKSVEPHPANQQNALVTVAVVDGETTFDIQTWGTDITPEWLAEMAGKWEQNLQQRDTAIAALKALVGQEITPTAPAEPDAKEVAYQVATAKLLELDRLVQLKVIASDAKEYTDALQTAKEAKAEISK